MARLYTHKCPQTGEELCTVSTRPDIGQPLYSVPTAAPWAMDVYDLETGEVYFEGVKWFTWPLDADTGQARPVDVIYRRLSEAAEGPTEWEEPPRSEAERPVNSILCD